MASSPIKKGTARLAFSAWQENIPLKVLPVGINYSSFHSFGKNIKLNFGRVIKRDNFNDDNSYGKNVILFNDELRNQLKELVIEINKEDKAAIKKEFTISVSVIKKVLLFIPSLLGWILHAPFYYPVKKIAWNSNTHKDHFDSILIGFLFVVYPFYLLFLSLLVYWLLGSWWWLSVFFVLPFFAWSFIQLSKQ